MRRRAAHRKEGLTLPRKSNFVRQIKSVGKFGLYYTRHVRVNSLASRFDHLTAEHRFLDFSRPRRDLLAVISEPVSLAKALALVHAAPDENRAALYVMQPGDLPVSKIGMSQDPHGRRIEHQTHSWTDISICGLIWGSTTAIAHLEYRCKYLGKREGTILRGEWHGLEPDEAIGLAIEAAQDRDYHYTDSQSLIDNLNASVAVMKIRARDIREHVRQVPA